MTIKESLQTISLRRSYLGHVFIDHETANIFKVDGISFNSVYVIYNAQLPTITMTGSKYRALSVKEFANKVYWGAYIEIDDDEKEFDFSLPRDSREVIKKNEMSNNNQVLISIFVPSTYNGRDISQDDFLARIARVEKWLCANFGGSTSISGNGSWVDENGNLVPEKVTIVQSIVFDGDSLELRHKVRNYCRVLRNEWAQDCILFTIQGLAAELVD